MNQRDSTLFVQRVLPNNYNALESHMGPNLFSLSHEFYFQNDHWPNFYFSRLETNISRVLHIM